MATRAQVISLAQRRASYALHTENVDVALRMWNTTATEFRNAIGADLRNWNKGLVEDSLRLEAVRQGIVKEAVKEIAAMTSIRDLGP